MAGSHCPPRGPVFPTSSHSVPQRRPTGCQGAATGQAEPAAPPEHLRKGTDTDMTTGTGGWPCGRPHPPPPGGCSGDSPTQSGKKMRRWEVWGGHPLLFPRCRSPLVALVTARGVSDSPGLGPQKTFLSLLQRDQGHPPSQGPGDISQTSSPATSWFPCGSRWGSEGR